MFYRSLFLLGFILPQSAAADGESVFQDYASAVHPGYIPGASLITDLAVAAGNFFAIPIAAIAIVAILYGGIRVITSAGNDQGKEEGKKIIITALIGLVLALAAEAIIQFAADFIGNAK